MKTNTNSFRRWLLNNGYEDVATIIDEIMEEWQQTGNKQRRNWMEILAGDKRGHPRVIAGRTLPILRAAQIRQGFKISENAICRNENEEPMPGVRVSNRWVNKK